MKRTVLNILAVVLAIGGVILAVVNLFYLLSGSGVYWETVGPSQFFAIKGWFDLQLGSKLHWAFIAKTVTILVALLIAWLLGAKVIKRHAAARLMLLVPACGALAFLVAAMVLRSTDQNDFIYKNGSALNLLVTLGFILLGGLIVFGSLGILSRDQNRYWLMVGFFVSAVANEIANLIIAAGFRLPASIAVQSFPYLAFFAVALVVALWSRTELNETNVGNDELVAQTT